MNPTHLLVLLVSLPLIFGSLCHAELRTWTAINGKEVEAEFVSIEKGIVKLKLKSGKVFEVAVDKLSNNDRQHIQSIKKHTLSANDNTHIIRKYNIDKLELLHFSDHDALKKNFTNAIDWNYLNIASNAEVKNLHFNKLDPKIHVVIDPNKSEPFSGWLKAKGAFNLGELESQESVSLVEFKNGKQHGVECSWYPNGKKRSLSYSTNGYADGKFTWWYETGNTKMVTDFKNGKNDGVVTTWHENGLKSWTANFKDGIKNGLDTKWYENGKKMEEVNYKDGKLEGLTMGWYENGKKRYEVNSKDGETIWRKYWNKKGQQVDTFKETSK